MSNRELYKRTMSGVHHSDEVVERIFDMTVDKKKYKSNTFRRIASATLALAVLVGGGLGANAIAKNNRANQPLSVMVAYADTAELEVGSKSPQKTFYGIYLAPTDDEEALKEAQRRSNADKAKILSDLDNKPKGATGNYGSGTFPCYDKKTQKETAFFYTVEGGNFSLTLEDYKDVKSFSVENTSEYGLLQLEFARPQEEYDKYPIFKDIDNATDEEWVAFEKEHPEFAFQNHEWHLTGDQLRYSQENYGECGKGKYKEKKGYFLLWAPSEELQDAIAENPHFDLTQIKDTITFTVEFNNGTVKTASVNLYFDSDGYMCFE